MRISDWSSDVCSSDLPDLFRPHIADVVIAIEEFADEAILASLDIDHPYELTGLYEGRPLTERSIDASGTLPDRVTLYRIPILVEWIEGGERLDWLVRRRPAPTGSACPDRAARLNSTATRWSIDRKSTRLNSSH